MANNKISMGSLIQKLSKDIARKGVPAQVADKVMREFWNTLQEALLSEGIVKVKGLGTFKVIDVKDRESVNVTNGERMLIKGYRKVSFSPDPAFMERGNNAASTNEPGADELPELSEENGDGEIEIVDMDSVETIDDPVDELSEAAQDKLRQVHELAEVNSDRQEDDGSPEKGLEIVASENEDAFGGIDLLIPTPESIADAEKEYDKAKADLEKAMEQLEELENNYRKIYRKLTFLRTGKVLDLPFVTEVDQTGNDEPTSSATDNNPAPEPVDNNPATTEVQALTGQPTESPSPADSGKSGETTRGGNGDADAHEAVKQTFKRVRRMERRKAHFTRRFLWIFLALMGVCVLAFFINLHNESAEKEKNLSTGLDAEVITEKKDKTTPAQAGKDTDSKQTAVDGSEAAGTPNADASQSSAGVAPSAPDSNVQQKRPATYILQKGQSLTDVSVMFYGTKDSVNAIIRNNSFRDPNNVFIGTEIKLP